jgi:hypothetical protein
VEGVSLLKNSFALPSAPGSGAENDVFVVFWPRFGPLLDIQLGDIDFFNTLKPSTHSGEYVPLDAARASQRA